MKKIINKRIQNDDIYKLLESGLKYIIRHYKVIKSKNYKNNEKNILSHKLDNNYFIADYTVIDNSEFDQLVQFNDIYESIDEIKYKFENAKNNAYDTFKYSVINKEFSEEEIYNLRNTIIKYLNDSDTLYIRLGIDPDNKEYFITKLYELYIFEYYNNLTEEKQKEIKEQSLLPLFNDTILYSNKKYEYLKNSSVKEIIGSEYDKINSHDITKNIEDLQ